MNKIKRIHVLFLSIMLFFCSVILVFPLNNMNKSEFIMGRIVEYDSYTGVLKIVNEYDGSEMELIFYPDKSAIWSGYERKNEDVFEKDKLVEISCYPDEKGRFVIDSIDILTEDSKFNSGADIEKSEDEIENDMMLKEEMREEGTDKSLQEDIKSLAE